ncbi:MAG: NUMOD4 domain-containing protein [Minisyncoccota bacterium]
MERWKDIVGFEGRYKISDTGKVFSLPQKTKVGINGGVVLRGGIELRQYKMKSGGHFRVYLADGSGKKTPKLVHRLVAQAFLSNHNILPVVNHIDSDPENNSVTNLEWCTVGHNNAHFLAHKTRRAGNQKGAANSQAKITEEIVLSVRHRYAECQNSSQVAREFGISPRHAHRICHRQLWKHI